jgi:hypothetical protein
MRSAKLNTLACGTRKSGTATFFICSLIVGHPGDTLINLNILVGRGDLNSRHLTPQADSGRSPKPPVFDA